MNRLPPRRSGFTLVEILVVIAIISVLAAVAVGALFRVRTAQDKTFTESTMQKVDAKLLQKLKSISEKVRDFRSKQNSQYQTAMSMAGDNPKIAEAILMYAYTKQQLPMTFAEANPAGPWAVNWTINGVTLQLEKSPIFSGVSGGTGAPEESAVCIYLALGNEGLEQQVGEITSGPLIGQKCYLDAYRQPICFNRLAFGGDNGTELDNPPFVKAPIATNTFDPFYPNPTNTVGYRNLAADFGVANANALWAGAVPFPNSTTNWASIPGIPPPGPPNFVYPGLKNHEMTLISGGLNKSLDVPGIYSGDNILSYRLRKEGQKGD